jgi:hypothetical protein
MVKGRNENDVWKVKRSRQPGNMPDHDEPPRPLAMPGKDGMGSSEFPPFARLYVSTSDDE